MVLVQYQLAFRGCGSKAPPATLDVPVDPHTTVLAMAEALKAKHGLADVRIHGPELEPQYEYGDLLYGYNYSRDHTCPDKFYVLCGGLYRRRPYGSEWGPLPSSTKLAPLLEFNSHAAGSSTAGSQAQPLQVHCSMQLTRCTIRTLSNKVFSVMTAPSMTVEELRLLVQECEGTPPDQQRLVFKGKQLQDGRTLEECGMVDDAQVMLILILRGGMYHETSGRQDNFDLRGQPLKTKMMQVTVVVPGHGDVTLTVDVAKFVTGGDLINMALQEAAKQKGFRV